MSETEILHYTLQGAGVPSWVSGNQVSGNNLLIFKNLCFAFSLPVFMVARKVMSRSYSVKSGTGEELLLGVAC